MLLYLYSYWLNSSMSKKTIINHFKITFYIAYHLVAYTFHDVRSLNVIRYPKILPHLVWSFDPFGRGFVIYKNRWHRDTKRQSTATSHLSRIWKHVCGYCSESLFILIYTLVCMHARVTFYDKRVFLYLMNINPHPQNVTPQFYLQCSICVNLLQFSFSYL